MIEIINVLTELALFICTAYFVVTKQDIGVIVFSCAIYVASVIRHSGKEN